MTIDFAYSIHTDVGHTMVGATINNKIAPIDRELQTGDIVSIKTNKNSKPSEDWLKIVKSNSARNKIRAYLNTINRDRLIEQGQDAIERECNKIPIDYPTDDFVKENFQKQGLNDLTALYLEVGKGIISPKTVVAKLSGKEIDREKLLERQMKDKLKREWANKNNIPLYEIPYWEFDNLDIVLNGIAQQVMGINNLEEAQEEETTVQN